MKILAWAIVLTLMGGAVSAQGGECVEVWSYWLPGIWHDVNLDTGIMTDHIVPESTATTEGINSPDGRYNAAIDSLAGRNRLTLTDRERKISVALEDHVSTAAWSPDSAWLAYIPAREDRSPLGLVLYNLMSRERLFSSLPEDHWMALNIYWSHDNGFIAVTLLAEGMFDTPDVLLFSMPDLTLIQTFKTGISLTSAQWSPDGNVLAAYGMNDQIALMDAQSGQLTKLKFDGSGDYKLSWSPNGSYLLITYGLNDFGTWMDIVNAQGQILVSDTYISEHLWINDHQALIVVWTDSGLYNLKFFDLKSGGQRVIQQRVGLYALSLDGLRVAANDSRNLHVIRIIDLSAGEAVQKIETVEVVNSLIWREDGSGIIALFDHESLRTYDFAVSEWHTVATVPADEWSLRRCGMGS